MGIHLVRRPELDVDDSAICFPARHAGCEVFISVREAPVVLLLEFVLLGVGIRIAAQPELLDELLPLGVVRKPMEGLALLVGDDVGDVDLLPDPEWRFEFLAEFAVALALIFFGLWFRNRFALDGLCDCEGAGAPENGEYHVAHRTLLEAVLASEDSARPPAQLEHPTQSWARRFQGTSRWSEPYAGEMALDRMRWIAAGIAAAGIVLWAASGIVLCEATIRVPARPFQSVEISGSHRKDVEIRAADAVLLRGWLFVPENS